MRSLIPVSYRQEAALKAAALFSQLSLFKQSKHIACYLATQDEFDGSFLLESIWEAQKNAYIPIIKKEHTLQFVRYQPGEALQPNRYTILEPVNVSEIIIPEDLDCVLMPLLAYDRKGHRLGTGGGYYDRTFSFLKASTHKKPTMLGVAYTVQQADFIPIDPWDMVMDGVVTEKEFILY